MLSRVEHRLLKGLHRRKIRESEALFLAEGVRVIEELLASPIVLRLAAVSSSLEDTERGARLRAALESRTAVRSVSDGVLAELAVTDTPQGVVVAAEVPRGSLEAVRPGARSVALVLDAVQDPGNVGTLSRAAAAFGVELLATLPGTADPWNAKSVRASAGALFRLPPIACEWAVLRDWLRSNGFSLYGADAAGVPVEGAKMARRRALVVGNEGAGLSEETMAMLDGRVAVPMRGEVESLNVAMAAGILLYLMTSERPGR